MSRPARFMNALSAGMFNLARRKYTKPIGPKMANKKFYKVKAATKVMNRKRKQQPRKPIQNPGGIITQTKYTSYRKAMFAASVRKAAGAPNYEIINGPGSFEALSGFQGSVSGSLFTQAALLRILNGLPASAPVGNFTRRFLLERIETKITYTNSSTASAILDIYQVVCKNDNDLSSALAAWSDGVNMETTLPAGTPPVNVLGIKPWHSQRFKEFFAISKAYSVNLSAGASHQHHVLLTPNRIMKEQYVRENVNYAGLTQYVLAVVKGVPVCDDAETPRLVSTAPIKIDIVTENNTKYRWISDVDTDLYITNNLTTLLQPENINAGTGLPNAVVSAA